MRKVFRAFPLLIVGSLLFGLGLTNCIKRPKDILTEKETVDLLADMQLAEAYISSEGGMYNDSIRHAIGEGVLLKHGVTRAELERTLAYYGKNTDEYYKLFDKVNKRIESKKKEITGMAMESISTENNIWPFSPFTYFSPNNASDGLAFSLTGELLTPGEALEWKMRFNNNGIGDGLLGIDYSDGTSVYTKKSIGGSRQVKLELQSDTGKVIKRIYGYMNVNRSSLPLWADSISLITIPFDSTSYMRVNMQNRYYGPRKRPREEKKDTVADNQSQNSEPSTQQDAPKSDSAKDVQGKQ